MVNKAAGAGYESTSNYPHIRLEFYNIGNIHVMRDSIKSVASLMLNSSASSDYNFGKAMEDTGWLTHVRLVLKASHDSAMFIARGDPVLVHCSHGWDRTAQVCSLAQVFLDPYYRTITGFSALVEKEWNSFGHAFSMRCAHGLDKATRQEDQISPIFLQFLDCMWQLVRQFPHHFEYSTRYLLTIADHIYSGRFGTFLFSTDAEREEYNIRRCNDIWTYLDCNRELFVHPLFVQPSEPKAFLPALSQVLRNIMPWTDYFYRWASLPSILVPAPDFADQLFKNGACISPNLSDVLSSPKNNDLMVPALVSPDCLWEGKYRKALKVQQFSLKQVESLTELLRSMNCSEERIAACLSGTFDSESPSLQSEPGADLDEEPHASVITDSALAAEDGEDEDEVQGTYKAASNALAEFGLDDCDDDQKEEAM